MNRHGIGLVLFLMATVVDAGQTYYVGTAGSDTNAGIGRTAPFATIQKAADGVRAGDTVIVMGGTYAGVRLGVSGQSNAYITLRADDNARVVLASPGPKNKRNGILEIETWDAPYVVSYWRVQGLHVTGSPKYGIDARSTQFVCIQSNYVSGSTVTGIFTPFCYDVRIECNTSVSNGEHGIYHNNSSDRFVICNNILAYNAGSGLYMNGDINVAPPAGTPWVWDGIMSEGVIEGNYIYRNGSEGSGINMDGVTDAIVRNNRIFASSNNNGIAMFKDDSAVASSRNWVINNTVFMEGGGGWAFNQGEGCVSNHVFNNILMSSHVFQGSITVAAAHPSGFESDYNMVVDRFSADAGSNNMSLAAWQALGYDTHSAVASPTSLVVNAAAGLLDLKPGSPAIDSGRALPADLITDDAVGVVRPLDGNHDGSNQWDIGALEYLDVPVDAGRIYYVGMAGSDINAGISRTAPFATIQTAVDRVQAGDTVIVMEGTYAGARLGVSGQSNAYITLRADDAAYVVLNSPGPENKRNGILEIETWDAPYVVSYWRVQGLRITGSPKYGIDARSTQFVCIQSNHVSGSVVTGIFTPFCYDVRIECNTSVSNGEHGIYHNNSSDRFVIRNNILAYNANAGLHMNGDTNAVPPAGTPWVWDGIISDGVIEGNYIYRNGHGGAGINMDGVTDAIVRNNRIFASSNNSGIAMFRVNGAIASSRNWVINNTVIMEGNGWAFNQGDGCVSNHVFNNILMSSYVVQGSITIAAAHPAGFESDYNMVVDRFSADGGGTRMTLASWRSLGYDAHSAISTPTGLVVNAAAGQLDLKPGSPAIDSGRALPANLITNDAVDVARPLDGNHDGSNQWDIGALEYLNPASDSDGDGVKDSDEIVCGTNPTDPLDYLKISRLDKLDDVVVLTWAGVAERTYGVWHAGGVAQTFTQQVSGLPAQLPQNVHTAAVADEVAGFYRITAAHP